MFFVSVPGDYFSNIQHIMTINTKGQVVYQLKVRKCDSVVFQNFTLVIDKTTLPAVERKIYTFHSSSVPTLAGIFAKKFPSWRSLNLERGQGHGEGQETWRPKDRISQDERNSTRIRWWRVRSHSREKIWKNMFSKEKIFGKCYRH